MFLFPNLLRSVFVRVKIACQLAAACSGKLAPRRAAKFLGTDAAGGRKRSMRVARSRLCAFSNTIHRIHKFRSLGGNSSALTRSAGSPAVTFGVEVTGWGDDHLRKTRGAIARASAPQAGGKNHELVLYVIDGPWGTLDPAFEAHCAPLRHWFLAWWERWIPHADLVRAFSFAKGRLSSGDNPFSWARVTGPVGAVLLSARRIGWT